MSAFRQSAFLILIFAAAAACRLAGLPNVVVQTATWVAIAWMAFAPVRGPVAQAPCGLPMLRSRRLARWLPALAAIAVALPTLSIPYLSDDYCLLSARGGASLEALFRPEDGRMFYRPLGWVPWWFLGKFAFDAPWVARIYTIILFAGTASLVPAALRRAGAPRATAHWAGILFACHPFSLETLAWLANIYSFQSLFFALASIAVLPVARLSRWRSAAAGALALASFLSKEEALLWLPAVGLFATARGSLRRMPRAAGRCFWIFAAGAVAVALRTWALGGVGGYKTSATGEAFVWNRIESGLRTAFYHELPTMYWIPVRLYGTRGAAATGASIFGFLLLAIAALSRRTAAQRHGARLLIWVTPFLVLPVANLLPSGTELAGARFFYSYGPFLALVLAAACGGLPVPAVVRGGICGAIAFLMIGAGRHNLDAWRESGDWLRKGVDLVSAELKQLPSWAGGRILVLGLPDNNHGALCFRNGAAAAILHRLPGVPVAIAQPPFDTGRFAGIYVFDAKRLRLLTLPDPERAVPVEPGSSWRRTVREGLAAGELRPHGTTTSEEVDDYYLFRAQTAGAGILLGTVEISAPGRLRVVVDGGLAWGLTPPEIGIVRRVENAVERIFQPFEKGVETGDGPRLSVEIRLAPGTAFRARAITITVEK